MCHWKKSRNDIRYGDHRYNVMGRTAGGPGSIAPFDNAGVLIISQTMDVHQKIGKLLNSLRHVKGLQGLPTIAPPARVSTPFQSIGGRQTSSELTAAARAAPAPRRRVVTAQRSWQVPQVYEE